MIPCSVSHKSRSNSMRSLSNTGPSRQLRDEAYDEGPAAKKCRAATMSSFATFSHQQQLMEDSLVAHLTRGKTLNALSELQLWSEMAQRRVSLSSLSSAHEEAEEFLNSSSAMANTRLRSNLASDSEKFAWGLGESFAGSPRSVVWRTQMGQSELSGSPSRLSGAYSSAMMLTPMKRERDQAFELVSRQISEQSDNGRTAFRRPSFMSDSAAPSWQPSNLLSSFLTYVPDEQEIIAPTHNHRNFATLQGETTTPKRLPAILALPGDRFKLSANQIFLRYQIEAFEATEDDVETHLRGRNKRIKLGQVGIRCRHCAHLPVVMRQKGSMYFPATLLALYQAAQNMSASHLQCGLCSQTPLAIKQHFAALLSVRASGAGRPYWAEAGKNLV